MENYRLDKIIYEIENLEGAPVIESGKEQHENKFSDAVANIDFNPLEHIISIFPEGNQNKDISFHEYTNLIQSMDQIEKLKKEQERLISLQRNLDLLRQLNNELQSGKNFNDFDEPTRTTYCFAINDPSLLPIVKFTKTLKVFKKQVNSITTDDYIYNTEKYYNSFADAIKKIIKENTKISAFTQNEERFKNIVNNFDTITAQIDALKGTYNRDNQFEPNVKLQLRQNISKFLQKLSFDGEMRAFSYMYRFFNENTERQYGTILASSLLSTLDTLDDDIYAQLTKDPNHTKEYSKDLNKLYELIDSKWYSDNHYKWMRKFKEMIENDLDFKTMERYNMEKIIFSLYVNNQWDTFRSTLIQKYQMRVMQNIKNDMFAKFPCLGYLYDTLPRKIDRSSEKFMNASNIIKYGALYQYFHTVNNSNLFFVQHSDQKFNVLIDQLKRAVIKDFFTPFYKKIGEILDIDFVYYNIEHICD